MNYSLNVKSSSIVHTLLSNCVKLLGKVQKLLIQCINYSVISKRIRVVSPKFYTVRKNFTGPPVPLVPTNIKSALLIICFLFIFLAIINGCLVNVRVLVFHNCCEVFPAFSLCFLVILTTSLLRLNSSALHPARILWSQKRDGVIIILHFVLKNVLFQI